MSQQSVTRFTKVGIDLLARVGQLKKLKIVMEGKFFLKVVLMQLPLSASISLYQPLSASIPGASISWTGPCAMRWTGRRTLISQSPRDAGWSRMIIYLNSMSMIQWGKWRQSCAYAQSTLHICTYDIISVKGHPQDPAGEGEGVHLVRHSQTPGAGWHLFRIW